jgi:hypothetical protein
MISGFQIPSCVVPLDENDATVVCDGLVVSVAPTVITNGSLAGACDVVPGPRLPDDTTTTTPAFQSFSTTASSAFVRYELVVVSVSERLMTPMCLSLWCASTQRRADMTSLERTPSGREMLIASMFASGAMPTKWPFAP